MDVSKVTIFDLENKFIAFSENFREGAREIICEWGQIYVLSNDGKVSSRTLHEHIFCANMSTFSCSTCKKNQLPKNSITYTANRFSYSPSISHGAKELTKVALPISIGGMEIIFM